MFKKLLNPAEERVKKLNRLDYYEIEAEEVNIFGNLREVCLSDNIISQIPKNTKTFIDVACGDGYILYQLKNSKKHKVNLLCGVDLSQNRLIKTRKNINSELVRSDLLNLPFKDNSFDTVLCSETIEHIKDYRKAIKELVRISNRNIIITTPNEESLTIEKCPKCNHHFHLNDHINSFKSKVLKEEIEEETNANVKKIIKFHTVFSYNNKTIKLPVSLRIFLDRAIVSLSKYLPFFKPNYLLISVKKRKSQIV